MSEVKVESIREPYEAPTVEDVPVRAEERLLAGCKNATASVPGFTCTSLPAPCQGFQAS